MDTGTGFLKWRGSAFDEPLELGLVNVVLKNKATRNLKHALEGFWSYTDICHG